MSWLLNSSEKASVESLTAAERVKYAINRIADWEELWSLRGPGGWVLYSDIEGRECIPVWPHQEFAASCADGDWLGTEPVSIPLDEWMEDWLPGISQDNRFVAIFPITTDNAAVITAHECECLIRQELDKIE